MKLGKFGAEGPTATIFGVMSAGPWHQEYPAVDYEACITCGTCQRYYPVDAITIREDQKDHVVFAWDFYRGCGVYANKCPKACIKMMPVGDGK